MTESIPPTTPEEIQQLKRDLLEKIIDRAASDPAWKQLLLDEPDAAMQEAGSPEAERIREVQVSMEAGEAEVAGHEYGSHGNTGIRWGNADILTCYGTVTRPL